jgi:hypothetical protein
MERAAAAGLLAELLSARPARQVHLGRPSTRRAGFSFLRAQDVPSAVASFARPLVPSPPRGGRHSPGKAADTELLDQHHVMRALTQP